MRITVDVPTDWLEDLKRAVAETGAQSRKAFVEALLAERLGREPVRKAWGGRRPYGQDRQDESLAKTTILGLPVEVDPDLPPNTCELRGNGQTLRVENVGSDGSRPLTPNEIIKANQAAARAKHSLPPNLPKK